MVITQLMVIDDNHIDVAAFGVLERFVTGRTTIDSNNQAGAIINQFVHRIDVGAIAFKHPVRNVDLAWNAKMFKKQSNQGRRSGTVNIIITENRYALLCDDRITQPRCRHFHILQGGRVWHQITQGWRQK